jgi:hypothetical protein
VPANCKIIDVKEYHSSGADSVLGSVGWRTRDGGSESYSAFIAEITKGTHSTMNVGGEGWKQLSAVSGTAFTYIVGKYLTTTKTVSLNATYSVLYTTDNEET